MKDIIASSEDAAAASGQVIPMAGAESAANVDVVAVLGVHRSGTSTLARAFKVFGADHGDRLMPPNPRENAKGFWEDLDVYELNVAMFKALGRDWHWLQQITPDDLEHLKREGFMLRALALLKNKTEGRDIFCFKDPRLCKLLPFWMEAFRRRGLEPAYAVSIRNPLSVVNSLVKRNGFPPEKCYLLWLEDVVNTVAGTLGQRNVIIDYDDLLKAPGESLRRIGGQLKLRINDLELQSFERDFVEESLRHSEYQAGDMELDPSCPELVREIYTELLSVCRTTGTLAAERLSDQLGDWQRALRLMDPALRITDAAMSRLKEQEVLEDSLQEANSRAQALKQELTEHGAALQASRRLADDLTSKLERATSDMDGLRARSRSAENAAEQARSSLATLTAQKEALAAQVDEQIRHMGLLQQLLETSRSEAAGQDSRLDALQVELAQKASEGDRFRAALEQALAEREALQARLSEQEAQLTARIEKVQAAASAAEAEVARSMTASSEIAAEKQALAAQLDEQLRHMDMLRALLEKAKEDATQHQARIATLESQLHEAAGGAAAAHSALEAAVSEKNALNARVQDQSAALQASQRSASEAAERLAQVTARVEELQQRASAAEAEVARSMTASSEIAAEKQALAAQLDEQLRHMDMLRALLEKAKEDATHHQARVAALESQLHEAAGGAAAAHSALEAAVSEKNALNARVQDQSAALQASQRSASEAAERLAQVTARVEELQQRTSAAEAEVARSRAAISEIAAEKQTWAAQQDEQLRHMDMLRSLLQESKDQAAGYEARIALLESQLNDNAVAANSTRAALEAAVAEADTLRRQVRDQGDALLESNRAAAEAAARLAEASTRVVQLQSELDSVQAEAQRAAAALREAADTNDALIEQVASQSAALQASERAAAETAEQLARESVALQASERLAAEAAEQLAQAAAANQGLTARVDERSRQVELLEGQLRATRDDLTKAAAESSALRRGNSELQEQGVAIRKQLAASQEELAQVRAARQQGEAALLLAANQQEKVLSDLKSLERELKDQGGRLAERETLIASLQQSLAGKQGEVERSAVQNHTLSMDLAQARRELTESRSAREILERKCEAQDQRIRELAASLESAQQDAINGRAQAEASARAVERLQGELQKEAVTIQQLIRAVVTSQAALDRLQRTWVGRLARRFGR